MAASFAYVTDQVHSPTATIPMEELVRALGSVVGKLSDQNYEQSLASYRFWFETGRSYSQIPSDLIFDSIWHNRPTYAITSKLIHPAAHLILRFASDAESDHILAAYSAGLQSHLCTRILEGFFSNALEALWLQMNELSSNSAGRNFYADANLIAHGANLGHIEEAAIRNHILQSLTPHPKLFLYQADALLILFKIAGATFAAYADPSVVDRCFELLKNHPHSDSLRVVLFQVSALSAKGATLELRQKSQEVVKLRERNWEGLPPPPVFTTGKPKPTGVDQKDPSATPVATSLGLPKADLEPQIPQPPPLESAAPSGAATTPASPVIQSPSISIATLSDFTIADTSDDESSIDTTTITPHNTFYLEDGNVEVLCRSTLFRVHTSVLSFHSPVLSQMLAKANLATAESHNGCPRISSSDTAADFATLLKIIYLPGYITLTLCR